ncbi:MAG: hemin receptor [Planctomycetes bacterium RIFCSPLOWO2_12_FULL_39_13]|nr:MAG: hemin receptor [Planctomycetes bacterium RIFCSPLOWO2_12_FULL_39_13]
MKAEQVAIVQKTFEKVRPISETAAELFYKRLFEINPSFRALFKKDMKTQGRMLMQMIDFAVKGLDDPETILPTIKDLGKRHVGYGVKEEYYDTVGDALLWTLEQGLGEDFTAEVKEAWAEAYKLLASVMKDAAKEYG